MPAPWVALRKESVDRNKILPKKLNRPPPSLSARRAWIEINRAETAKTSKAVALRKESVDRNMPSHWIISRTGGSLSARRAWIEIAAIRRAVWAYYRRSPQGERG